ncbi:glycosyltransferase family 2 protein [Pseudoalteromonas gelatinilytica]|uniref:Glycosyltransferase family 2 protein n=1 Tax=Pseudoalteromonas gelatinilytica TaxID=1703256 RepID=A0A3A3EMG4_9GAMM|nr:glycosyltransferase family 2 protein [Pseudoalteromonas profundi]RJF34621.1 glycosyltransferase family 2 protein [Pseudoalteromonas profundi]
MTKTSFISHKYTIVICTRNRVKYLSKTVEQLLTLINQSNESKLLIVNNNSTDNTASYIKFISEKNEKIDSINCTEVGLGNARNAAISHCDTEWIVYLDDDALVADDWLIQLNRIASSYPFDAFGGLYTPWYAEGKKAWFYDEFETNVHMFPKDESEGILKTSYFSGGIAAYKLLPLKSVGGFPTDIGMSNNKISYGEEIHTQRNLAMAGYKLGFSKLWKMIHLTPLKKQSLVWSWKKQFALGRDFWEIYNKKKDYENLKRYSTQKLHKLSPYEDFKKFRSINACVYKMASISFVFGLFFGYMRK